MSITFTCELEGCNNEKTVGNTIYERNNHHYCSTACYAKARMLGEKKEMTTIHCDAEGCNGTRVIHPSKYGLYNRHFCSQACFNKSRRTVEDVTFTCQREGCGKERTQKKSQYLQSKNHYCGRDCHIIDRTGRTPKEIKINRRDDFKRRWKEMKWNTK